MARTTFIILAMATLNSSGFIGFDGEPEKREGKPERGRRPDHQEMMKRLDSNKDGEISFAEFSASERIQALDEVVRRKLFDRLDKDGSGVISKKELRPPHDPKGPRGGFGFPLFEKLDTNKDRKVSFEEFSQNPRFKEMPAERVRRFFDQMDRNKDGFLSRKDQPKPGPRGKKGGRPEGGIKNLDTDGDGKVSKEEFMKNPLGSDKPKELRKQLFQKLDQNNDGVLDSTELRDPKRGPKK